MLKLGPHTKRLTVRGDRIFAPINDLLIILSALAHATSIMVGGSTHTTEDPVLRVTTRWPDYGFGLPLRGPLEHALSAKTPLAIEIAIIADKSALQEPLHNIKHQTPGLQATLAHVISPIFLMFFERYNDWLDATYGDAKNWPATLNFSRVVRNSIAHGKIKIRNPAAPSVRWRDLEYGYKDNGHQIIGSDIKLGEMVALIFDVSDALDSLNAPLL